ncbi:UNVERIFIED_CONTAM: hypothetical protein PYX00_010999 [Menopon gallinae]|uniref:V-type ATP synthase subunit I n=1 Tax=Menopon gallinae TaxID=328185 RepID=A0AAW2H6Y8_9NEOP
MKKVILLTMDQFKKETLNNLAELGLVHIQNYNRSSLDLDLAQADKKQLEEAISALDTVKVSVTTVVEKAPLFGLDLAKTILKTQETIKKAKERVSLLEQEKSELVAWGNFKLSTWLALKEATGARLVQLTAIARTQLAQREDLALILTRPFSKSNVWVPAVLIPNKKNFDWTGLSLEYFNPSRDLQQIEECLEKEKKIIDDALTHLKEYNKYKLELDRSLQEQNYRVLFESVLASGRLVKGVAYWEGFIPVEGISTFKEATRLNGWAYALLEPNTQDNVPTQLKLNAFTKNASSQHVIIFMVLALGFTQIMLAHFWNFLWEIKEKQGIKSLAQLGWLMIYPIFVCLPWVSQALLLLIALMVWA